MTHELKTWPEYFGPIWEGKKYFELRKNDRGFNTGDVLRLIEYDQKTGKYSGRYVDVTVQYILHGPILGIKKGYCIMSFTYNNL